MVEKYDFCKAQRGLDVTTYHLHTVCVYKFVYISVNMYNYWCVSGVLKPNANCKLVFMI